MATAIGTYATLSDVKLRLQDADTADDTLLQKFCDQANMWVEGKTERIMAPLPSFSTTLNGAVSAGATSAVVTSATGLSVNDVIMLGAVSATHESVAVAAISGTTVTFATALANAYANGVAVKRVYIFHGFDAVDNTKILPIPMGITSMLSLEVCTFSAGQGGATVTNVTWYQIPNSDLFLLPTPQERTPGWPALAIGITNVPVPTDTVPAFFPGWNNVRVDGTLGFPAQPDDIVEAALNIAVALYRARGSTGGEVVHVGTDGAQVINRALTYEDRLTIKRYQRHDVSVF